MGRQLAAAHDKWVLVVSHQPLASSEGGGVLLARGGYWQITMASLIDYPQQARALRIVETAGGGVAIQTWMLDHVFPSHLGTIARQLAFLDAQGGRAAGFAGGHRDRNVTLFRRAAA